MAAFWRTALNIAVVWCPTVMVAPPGKCLLNITSSTILPIGSMVWKHNVICKTGSTSQHCQRRTEPQPQAICTKMVKVGQTVFELCERIDTQTHRQTNRHTHHNIVLPYRGEITRAQLLQRNHTTRYVNWNAVTVVNNIGRIIGASTIGPKETGWSSKLLSRGTNKLLVSQLLAVVSCKKCSLVFVVMKVVHEH